MDHYSDRFDSCLLAIGKVQESLVGLKLNGTHQLLAYANDMNVMGDTLEENRETLFFFSLFPILLLLVVID
jgi:hypothetical protein